MVKHPNIKNKSPLTSTVNNYPDNCNNKHSNITIIPYSNDSVSLASNDSRQSHATNPLVLTSPNMSYIGTGANPMKRSSGSQVGQRMYPLESVAIVTTATNAQLTTLLSSGWEPRTGYGVPMEEPAEQPALHAEVSGVHTLSATEREARSSHTVRKRKECPTTEENTHIRSDRYKRCLGRTHPA